MDLLSSGRPTHHPRKLMLSIPGNICFISIANDIFLIFAGDLYFEFHNILETCNSKYRSLSKMKPIAWNLISKCSNETCLPIFFSIRRTLLTSASPPSIATCFSQCAAPMAWALSTLK